MFKQKENFIGLCLKGRVLLDEIDDYVEKWHKSAPNQSLHDFLGMTWDEYSLWVADNDILPYIVTAHKENEKIEDLLENFYYHLPMAARAPNQKQAKILMSWLKAKGKLD